MAASGSVIPHVIKSDLCKSIPGGKKQQSNLHNFLIAVILTPVKRHKIVLSKTHVQCKRTTLQLRIVLAYQKLCKKCFIYICYLGHMQCFCAKISVPVTPLTHNITSASIVYIQKDTKILFKHVLFTSRSTVISP